MKEIKTEQIEERDSKEKKIEQLNKKYENSRNVSFIYIYILKSVII